MHSESKQKIALLHYWLLKMRGGEMVLEELCRMFPDAEIFTHAVIRGNLSSAINAHPIHESFIARLPWGRRHCQKFLPLMPSAQRCWDFSGYDLIISSESGPVKGIRKPAGCRHVCFCHTPMRYLWDLYSDYRANAGWAGKVSMTLFRNYLRRYDLKSAECVDRFVANSDFVAERIRRIYGRESVVVHPPVEVEFFGMAPKLERRHYLFVGQLVCYKQPETVIRAFAGMGNQKLLVIGEGPLRRQLERLATPNVEFCNWVSREKLRELYASAKALIFPGVEDFGIVPVEAQAAGCPVVALGAGGALETVVEGKTGLFFTHPAQLPERIEAVGAMRFAADDFQNNVARFSASRFRRELRSVLNQNE